jgi:hypothetical protein
VLPLMPGMPERRSHDYYRHGITSLFALAAPAPRLPGVPARFLKKIDKNVPAGLEVHLVCDNYGTHQTPQIQAWLQRHPRFRMHFTRPARRGSTRPGAGSAS